MKIVEVSQSHVVGRGVGWLIFAIGSFPKQIVKIRHHTKLGSGVGFLPMKIVAKSNGDVSGYVLLFGWSDGGPHGHK